jgi:type II secretory pathway predicted ATPase ExeA
MYEAYYHLSRRPFDDGATPEFYFPSGTHQAALLKLRYLIDQRKGIGLIAAEHGLGKTFLTHVLEQSLEGEGVGPFLRLVIPQLSPAGTLAYFASRLGAAVESVESDQRVLAAVEEQLELRRQSGEHPVLLIDDAHLLEIPHLNLIRLLLNLKEDGRADFSVILSGRTELLSRLSRIGALDQRIVVRTALQPLKPNEIASYVRKRLQTAGCEQIPFHERTAETIWELSQGIPRRINQLCDLAMLVGFADELSRLGPVEIEAAAEELRTVTF